MPVVERIPVERIGGVFTAARRHNLFLGATTITSEPRRRTRLEKSQLELMVRGYRESSPSHVNVVLKYSGLI